MINIHVRGHEIIQIGVISPSTSYPPNYQEIITIASEDINQYCIDNSLPYIFDFIHDQNNDIPSIALETVQGFYAMGINIIVENVGDSIASSCYSYTQANDIAFFSSRSATNLYAINDNYYRLTSNYETQADIITDLYIELGIKAIVVLHDNYGYGKQLKSLIESQCQLKDIDVLYTTPFWNPDLTEISTYISNIDYYLESVEYLTSEIGVQMISTEKDVDYIFDIISYDDPNFEEVKWFVDEPITIEIEKNIPFFEGPKKNTVYGIKKAPEYNSPNYITLNDLFQCEKLSYYHTTCYDTLWILAKTIIETGSTDTIDIMNEFVNQVKKYEGISGEIRLDLNGDRKQDNYDVMSYFEYKNGNVEFIRSGYYDQYSNEITIFWRGIYPPFGHLDSTFCISGGGFLANSEWTMKFGDLIDPISEVNNLPVNSDGTFSNYFVVPTASEGRYDVYAIDDVIGTTKEYCYDIVNADKTPYFPPISLSEYPRRQNIELTETLIYPVQSAWLPDPNGDSIIDLVLNKPMAVVVEISNDIGDLIDIDYIEIQFEGRKYKLEKPEMFGEIPTLFTHSSKYNPIIPRSIGIKEITGRIVYNTGFFSTLPSRTVQVHEISEHAVIYHFFERMGSDNYGTLEIDDYYEMVNKSNIFLNATYPTKIISQNDYYNMHTKIDGKESTGGSNAEWENSVKKDIEKLISESGLAWDGTGSPVAIGIGPANDVTDYFDYHGRDWVAGASYGSELKGVVCLDDYYVAAAHELAHLKDLYYTRTTGIPEQYLTNPKNGILTTGVWVAKSEWRTGFDVMGSIPYDSYKSWILANQTLPSQCTFIDTDETVYNFCPYTYNELFIKLNDPIYDPEILLASGVIYKDGTAVMEPTKQYRLPQGYPHNLVPGNYALQFISEDGTVLGNTSFHASFTLHLVPKRGKVDDRVLSFSQEIDYSPFSFATVFPNNTEVINLVNIANVSYPLVSIQANDINERLHADAGASYSSRRNSSLILNASRSYSPYGEISLYTWDLNNDGDYSDATGEIINYTWTKEGTYIINLMVSDEKGRIDIDSTKVTIRALESPKHEKHESILYELEKKTIELNKLLNEQNKTINNLKDEIHKITNQKDELIEQVKVIQKDNDYLIDQNIKMISQLKIVKIISASLIIILILLFRSNYIQRRILE
jgi:ABC-type branched-subunit amino acid transport system substrate-binding protein